MTTAAALIAQATQMLQSTAGYSYNPAVLAATIEAGSVPVGARISANGKTAVWQGDRLDLLGADGAVVASKPIAGEAALGAVLVQYAIGEARTSVRTSGTI